MSSSEEAAFYQEAFSRNLGLLTSTQQERLRTATIAIAGLGGVGGVHASTLARLGVGGFHIADLDSFEVVNINRQAAATVATVGKPKVAATENMIHSINPYARVTVFPEGIGTQNIDAFLTGVDVVIDGLDFFNIAARRLLYAAAREHGLFVLTAGPIGFGSSLLVFDPQGMSFEDYFDIHDGQTEQDQLLRFGLGVTPTLLQRRYFKPEAVNWKDKKSPSLVTGTLLAANLVSCDVIKILSGEQVSPAPTALHFDPYLRTLRETTIPWGNRHPWQRLKLWIASRVLRRKGRL